MPVSPTRRLNASLPEVIPAFAAALRDDGDVVVGNAHLLQRTPALLSDLVGLAQVDLRGDAQIASPGNIGFGHAVLATRPIVAAPSHRATLGRRVAADVAKVEAAFESVMPVGIVIDHMLKFIRKARPCQTDRVGTTVSIRPSLTDPARRCRQ